MGAGCQGSSPLLQLVRTIGAVRSWWSSARWLPRSACSCSGVWSPARWSILSCRDIFDRFFVLGFLFSLVLCRLLQCGLYSGPFPRYVVHRLVPGSWCGLCTLRLIPLLGFWSAVAPWFSGVRYSVCASSVSLGGVYGGQLGFGLYFLAHDRLPSFGLGLRLLGPAPGGWLSFWLLLCFGVSLSALFAPPIYL